MFFLRLLETLLLLEDWKKKIQEEAIIKIAEINAKNESEAKLKWELETRIEYL